jgi:macrolide transport system ATP-binding/permease protein
MRSVNLQFVDVSFSYDSSPEIILSSLNLHFSGGWTGIIGANGVGKSTVAKLAAGILLPSSGHISPGGFSSIYCEQETLRLPSGADDFICAGDSRAGELRSVLIIENDWYARWNSLSHGERKRFQVGVALWRDPDILVLDEPTNHLDQSAVKMLSDALLSYRGTGIIVSHDRSLLDLICANCIFMRPDRTEMHAGNFSEGEALEELYDASRAKEYSDAVDVFRKAEKSARALKHRESSKKNSLSKKNISKHDHDAKSRIDLARLTGKDKQGARKVRLMEERSLALLGKARLKYFEKRETDGIIFRGERLRCDRIVSADADVISLGEIRTLVIPDLIVRPDSRIAITGNNGAGKSVLISYLLSKMNISRGSFIYIPQEIGEDIWKDVLQEISELDDVRFGSVLTAVYRLGSEPERILSSSSPSPGEKRKIMFGLGLLRKPGLIIMDEPTNHMDIPSINCLEKAVSCFLGALIIVSHDRRFLKKITDVEWAISRKGNESQLSIRM